MPCCHHERNLLGSEKTLNRLYDFLSLTFPPVSLPSCDDFAETKSCFFPPLPFAALYTTEERGDFPMCYRSIQPPSAQVGEQQILFSEDLLRKRAGFKRKVLHAHKEIVKPHTVSINGNSFSFWHDGCTHCSLICNRPILTTQERKRRQGSD